MIIIGEALTELKKLEPKSINCCVTSPPYFGLRDYGHENQIGLEETPGQYVESLVEIFREVSRVLKDDGTLWLNLGDSYAGNGGGDKMSGKNKTNKGSSGSKYRTPGKLGLKPKDLIGIPWRVAFALQEDGWYLRQDIIWSKPNPMPESVKDRCTKAHEYIFIFSKKPRYYFNHEAIKEPAAYPNGTNSPESIKSPHGQGFTRANSFKRKTATRGKPGAPNQHREEREDIEFTGTRNKRSVWTVPTKPYKGAHFATFPPDLIKPCILAGCPQDGIVLDCFGGSGTVGEVAKESGRDFILIELNPKYKPLIDKRIETAHYQSSF